MDLKVSGLGSKWNTLLNKGASIAKESLDFVNKQIIDIKTTVYHDDNQQNDDPSANLKSYVSSTASPNDDPIASALLNHQIPVFYYCQPSICPGRCTTCHPSSSSTTTTHQVIQSPQNQYRQQSTLDSSSITSAADYETHVFFLPPSVTSIHNLTVRQLKDLLPPSITTTTSSSPENHSLHLRFKSSPPIEDQDLFTDYVWLDVDDDMNPPTFRGSIHIRPLTLAVVSSPRRHSHLHHHRQRPSHSQLHQRQPPPPSSAPTQPWESSASIGSNKLPDLLGSGSNYFDAHFNQQQSHHHSSTSSSPHPPSHLPSTTPPQTDLDRASLISQREAKKEARIQEVMNQHAARREREVAEAEAKYSASEELKEQLDRWALTSDGAYKDLRALLSSLPDVLWEEHQWQAVSLSDLVVMRPNEFRKVYKSALLVSHPDKHQTSSPQTQFRAQRIFQALNESFKSLS